LREILAGVWALDESDVAENMTGGDKCSFGNYLTSGVITLPAFEKQNLKWVPENIKQVAESLE